MGVGWGGILFGVSVGSSLGLGVGGFLAEVLHTIVVGVFAFGDIFDFPEWFWIFFTRDFLLLLLG